MTENPKEITQTTAQFGSRGQSTVAGASRPRLSEIFMRLLKFTGTSTLDFDPDGNGAVCLSSAAEMASSYLDDDVVKATSPADRNEYLLSPVEQLSYVLAQIAQLGLLTEAMKRARQMTDESEVDLLAVYADKALGMYAETGLTKVNDGSLDGMLWLLDNGVEVLLQAYQEAGGLSGASAGSESKATSSGTGFPLGINTLRGGVGVDGHQEAEEPHAWVRDDSDCARRMQEQAGREASGDEPRHLDAYDGTCKID